MRICYLSTGRFSHVAAYLDYFRAAGHDVRFVALSPSPPREVPVYNVGWGAYERERGKWKYPLSALRARGLVRALKPDVVHAHYATSGGLAALVCGLEPTIVTAHGTDLAGRTGSPVWRPLLKAVFARAALVNTVSAELTRLALSLGVEPSKIVELTPGVDVARCRAAAARARRPAGPLKLICTRRLEPLYDHRAIIEALAILVARGLDFRMTFAGDGSLRRELGALASSRGLGGRVAFLGEVSAERVPELLASHNAYISASRSDGASLALLEAMACGLFPIVSRIPANEAWLAHGDCGRLFAAGDPGELADCVVALWRQPELAARAAAINPGKVAAAGDRAANMRSLQRIYESVARRR